MLISLKHEDLDDMNHTLTSIQINEKGGRKQGKIPRCLSQGAVSDFCGCRNTKTSLGTLLLPTLGPFACSGYEQSPKAGP